MNEHAVDVEPLKYETVDALPPGRTPEMVVVLCHGFGAPGDDLVPLAGELLQVPELRERTRFVFPQAPLSLASLGMPGGRAWWMLDMEKLNRAMQFGEFRDMRTDCPDGLAVSRAALERMLADLQKETGLPRSRFVLGGFSQGAMLATDVSFRSDQPPGGLCILSGTLLCEEQWRNLAGRRAGLPVFQSHGTLDPLLPFEAARWLHDLLIEAGLQVQFHAFRGQHAIPRPVLEDLAGFLADRARES